MDKPNKWCQSCGMPLNKDEKGGGTNADGSRSLLYCSLCYSDGAFTRPDFTLSDMKALVRSKLKELGFPAFLAWFFTLNMGRLKRWRE